MKIKWPYLERDNNNMKLKPKKLIKYLRIKKKVLSLGFNLQSLLSPAINQTS
jgi:hypothetical protein